MKRDAITKFNEGTVGFFIYESIYSGKDNIFLCGGGGHMFEVQLKIFRG